MSRKTDEFESQIPGQMSIEDLYEPPERLFAVSRIFARARKEMSLAEQKAFVYALSQMNFKEKPESNYIRLNKKTLAKILELKSDTDHLSVHLFDSINGLPKHSLIEISKKDLDFFASGFIVTSIVSFKNFVRIRFNEDFLPLFTNLSTDYITMWSADIFQMKSKRSVQFYETLRQYSDTRLDVNQHGWSTKLIKEMFDIPAEGKGSYMRTNGGFDRGNFEKKVLDPLCEDLKGCRMINLVVQPDGKLYEKVKSHGRVEGYRFYWTLTTHPAVATAAEVQQIQERVDKDPQVLKVAKDIVNGKPKPKKEKKNTFSNFGERDVDYAELQRVLIENSMNATEEGI